VPYLAFVTKFYFQKLIQEPSYSSIPFSSSSYPLNHAHYDFRPSPVFSKPNTNNSNRPFEIDQNINESENYSSVFPSPDIPNYIISHSSQTNTSMVSPVHTNQSSASSMPHSFPYSSEHMTDRNQISVVSEPYSGYRAYGDHLINGDIYKTPASSSRILESEIVTDEQTLLNPSLASGSLSLLPNTAPFTTSNNPILKSYIHSQSFNEDSYSTQELSHISGTSSHRSYLDASGLSTSSLVDEHDRSYYVNRTGIKL